MWNLQSLQRPSVPGDEGDLRPGGTARLHSVHALDFPPLLEGEKPRPQTGGVPQPEHAAATPQPDKHDQGKACFHALWPGESLEN